MTIPAQTPKNQYVASGSPTFVYAFKIQDASELLVYGNTAPIVTGLTVTGVGLAAGGTVTISPTPANGVIITLLRRTIRAQATDWTANDPDPAEAKEQAFDRAMAIDQEQDATLNRVPQYKITDSLVVSPIIDTPVVGSYAIAKDTAGNLGWGTPVSAGSITVPVPFSQGGTGANYSSAAAMLQGVGGAVWGSTTKNPAAGTITNDNPLGYNTNIVTTNGAVDHMTGTGVAIGTQILVVWSNGGNVLTNLAGGSGQMLLQGGQTYTTVAFDRSLFEWDGSSWIELYRMYQNVAMPEAGRFQFVSATQVAFLPFKGRKLPVKDAANGWQLRDIGASGVVSGNPTTASNFVNGVASQVLAANTTYLVCVFVNSGVLTLDFRTTLTHAADAVTGVEIRSGDDTRTVVGMVRTNATPNFSDGNALRGVISWFNRRLIGMVNRFTTNRTASSGTYGEINTEIRCNHLTWADEAVIVSLQGAAQNNTATATTNTSIMIDSGNEDVWNGVYLDTNTASAHFESIGMSVTKSGLADGFHFATLVGSVSSGTGTWAGGGLGIASTSLSVCIRG